MPADAEDFPTRSFSRRKPERQGPFVHISDEQRRLELEGYLVGHVLMEPGAAQEAMDEMTIADLTLLELEMRGGREQLHLYDYDPLGGRR